MNDIENSKEHFDTHGYTLERKFLSEDLLNYLTDSFKVAMQFGSLHPCADGKCPVTPLSNGLPKDGYSLPFTELLLPLAKNRLEKVIRKKLIPSYSYIRVYGKGCYLIKHIDRPACEYSVTLTLFNDTGTVWPFFVQSPKLEEPTEIMANTGDAIIYKGTEIPHWREQLETLKNSGIVVQIFLHFVDEEGMYTDHAFDKINRIKMNWYNWNCDILNYNLGEKPANLYKILS